MPEEPKLEAQRSEPGWGSCGGGLPPPPHQLGCLGSTVNSPSVVWGKAPATKSFGAFWILQVSSPAVLLLHLGVIHSSFRVSACKFSGWLASSSRKILNYYLGEKILLPLRFQLCWVSAPAILTSLFALPNANFAVNVVT